VNNARRNYSQAVDQYNFLVGLYNATSATISRPVFLPYVYRQGNVRHGWHMSGSIRAGSAQARFNIDEIDSDFVRLDTRTDDRNSATRRDDLLDILVGTERLVDQLAKAAARVHEKAASLADNLRIEVRADLSVDERALISAALYPFKDGQGRTFPVPRWAGDAIKQLTLPMIAETGAPALNIRPPLALLRNGTPEQIAASYGPAVALIIGRDGSRGSGALISSDGLVLTAAHVLRSAPFEVSFPRVDNRRRRAELVFANDTHDVALLRVVDYRAERWMEVAVSEHTTAGEPVVALGNPYIPGSGVATGSVSNGIVARPYDPKRSDGMPDLIADIAIASGSSGGPLISRKTGKIVGVVTAVVQPSVKADFATSGFWAVAAPSTELRNWLGLRYSP
jgi:hypothetical protein